MTEEFTDSCDNFLEVIIGVHQSYFQHKEFIDLFLELGSKMPAVVGNMKPASDVTDIAVSFKLSVWVLLMKLFIYPHGAWYLCFSIYFLFAHTHTHMISHYMALHIVTSFHIGELSCIV